MYSRSAILIVEDDEIQAGYLEALLAGEFKYVRLQTLSTEEAFIGAVAGGWIFGFSAIVLDCHLPMSDRMQEEERDLLPTRYRAGVRCLLALRGSRDALPIPVVVRTLVDARDLAPELKEFGSLVECVGKKVTDDKRLIQILRKWLPEAGLPSER